jgi:hypothetical protein
MTGKSPLAASAEQRDGLKRLTVSANRAEADRARAILLSLSGWTSAAIGEVFGVREDTGAIAPKLGLPRAVGVDHDCRLVIPVACADRDCLDDRLGGERG